MFSFDTEDPRFKSVLRAVQYAFLTALVVVGTFILVSAGQGYDINRSTGEVIQNGLLLVNSEPDNSVVVINDVPEDDITPSRLSLPAGDYAVRIEAPGYRTWSKQISVEASIVEWVYYPLLIPNELKTSNLTALRDVEFVAQGLNGERLILRLVNDAPVFRILTLNNDVLSNDESVTLPVSILDLPGEQLGVFGFEGWASDNRHVLLTHTLGSRTDFIWFDVEAPQNSINLTKRFSFNLTDARFIDGRPNELYVLENGNLRRLNLQANTATAPIIDAVDDYVMYKDQFLIYKRQTAETSVEVGLIERSGEPKIIASHTAAAEDVLIEFAEFDGTFYLARLDVTKQELILTPEPQLQGDRPAELAELTFRTDQARYLSFSRNGRFVTVQGGSRFLSYDLDTERQHQFALPFSVANDYRSRWIDGYRLVAHNSAETLHVFEFDGGNLQPLLVTNPEFNLFFDGNFEHMYSLSLPSSGSTLFIQSTSLRNSVAN